MQIDTEAERKQRKRIGEMLGTLVTRTHCPTTYFIAFSLAEFQIQHDLSTIHYHIRNNTYSSRVKEKELELQKMFIRFGQ